MKPKTLVVVVLLGLALLTCGLVASFLVIPRFAPALRVAIEGTPAPGSGPGSGRGIGGGPMMGRGGMMGGPGASGTPSAQQGNTSPSGGSGRLTAVTADGKAISSIDASERPENTASQTIGSWNVTLALSPYPPVSFQNGAFDITLVNDKGQAIADATISLDLTMPGMWMPPSKPEAQSLNDGHYRATAFWTMRGLWRIEVIVTRGNQKQSAFFDVWL